MRQFLLGAMASLLGVLASSTLAQGGTATDAAVSLTYSTSHWDDTPNADLLGATSATDPLYQSGWFYRVDGDSREYPFPAPDSETYGTGLVTVSWNNVDGKGIYALERTLVFDNEGPSGGFVSIMTIRNDNPGLRQVTLFHYVDVDLASTIPGDSGTLVNARFLKFSEGARTVRYKAMAPAHYKVGAAPSVRALLADASLTTLDDAGLPFGPGDASAAFQFLTLNLSPGAQAVGGTVSVFSDLPADQVKGDLFGVASYPSLFTQLPDLSSQLFTFMRRTTQIFQGTYAFSVPAGTAIAGIGDFNADSYDEPVSRHPVSGVLYVGGVPVSGAPTLPLNWKVSATGDFNADGRADIVWRNTTSQKLVIWTMNGSAVLGSLIPTPDQAVDGNWEVSAAADFDGDGLRDFLWYNQTTGKIVIWYMNASVVRITGGFTNPSSVGNNNWRVVAVGDFGKGPASSGTPQLDTQDIVWQNDTSLKLVVWHMDHAAQRTGGLFTTPDAPTPGHKVVGPR